MIRKIGVSLMVAFSLTASMALGEALRSGEDPDPTSDMSAKRLITELITSRERHDRDFDDQGPLYHLDIGLPSEEDLQAWTVAISVPATQLYDLMRRVEDPERITAEEVLLHLSGPVWEDETGRAADAVSRLIHIQARFDAFSGSLHANKLAALEASLLARAAADVGPLLPLRDLPSP